MILKIATGNGWRFLDKVKELHVEEFASEVAFNKQDKPGSGIYDNVFLHYHELKANRTVKRNDSLCNSNKFVSLVEIIPTFIGGESKVYLADLAVYLMSDEGKTVERIN